MNEKKAIVLGGTNAHIDLINKLKNRGYYIYLIDYLDNPIAKEYADRHIKESTLDKEKVLKLAIELNVELVIATSVDQANITACYVMEKLGLYVPYSYKTSLEVTNKISMKKKMIINDISTAKLIVSNFHTNNMNNINYPIIVKPANCNGSKGVHIVKNYEEYIKYYKEAKSLSRTDEVIVEEYLEGIEIGCDCFISKGKAIILTIRQRNKIEVLDSSLQQIKGTICPAEISKEIEKKIQKIMQSIADVFGLDNTPLMAQLIVNEKGVYVIEFAPRIGGGESGKFIKEITNFDIVEAAIDSYLGNNVDVQVITKYKYYSDVLIYGKSGIFEKLIGFEDKKIKDKIEYYVQYKTKGSNISDELVSANRIAAFVTSANTIIELKEKINTIIDNIDVYDNNNNSIILREISKYKE